MASLRVPALRHTISGAAPYLRVSQRRWAQVHDVRFLATQQSSRVLDKYKEKLDQKAKEEGLRDIHELKEAYAAKIEHQRKEASIQIPLPNTPPPSPVTSPFPPPPPAPQIPAEKQAIKTLSSYLDVEKARALPAKELEAVWRLRHASNARSLCATIPLSTYRALEATAKAYPHFILPLPREGQGAEIHFLQWTFPAPDTVTVLFTHLAEYKLRGEYSQPHTTVTHHLELAETGAVLMKGEVMEGRGVSVEEARWLVMCLQKFYGVGGEESGRRRRLVEMFGRGDRGFSVEELVDEAEKIV